MSPVARRQGGAHTGRAVVVAIVGVGIALLVAFGVATLASRGDVEVRLGDDSFDAGNAETRAETVADGGPILFPDVARFTRAVYLDHAGDDPDTGWFAVGAFVPDDPDCSLTFDTDADVYVSSCDEGDTYPRSGDGLRRFDVTVTDGNIFVDIADRAEPTD